MLGRKSGILIVALAGAALCLPATAQATDNGEIVYVTADGLRTLFLDGTPGALLPNTAGVQRPVFSRDGGRLAGEKSGDIVLVDPLEGGADPIDFPGLESTDEGNAEFFPDGRLAFDRNTTKRDVWSADPLPGGGLTQLTTHPTRIGADPSVSPDGTRIAFRAGSDVATMAATGGDEQILGFGFDPQYSPDGTQIVYVDGSQIAVRSAAGGPSTQLTDVGGNFGPQWSPDGTQIVFQSNRAGNDDIWVMNADGSDQRNLTPDSPGFDQRPAWRPIGNAEILQPTPGQSAVITKEALDGAQEHPQAVQLAAQDQLVPGEVMLEPDGTRHVRMERTYKGVPVIGGDLVTHIAPDGTWREPSLTLERPLNLSVTPLIPALLAKTNALLYLTLQLALLDAKIESPPRLRVDAGERTRGVLVWVLEASGKRLLGGPEVRKELTIDARTGATRRVTDVYPTFFDTQGNVEGIYKPQGLARGNVRYVDLENGFLSPEDWADSPDFSQDLKFRTDVREYGTNTKDWAFGGSATTGLFMRDEVGRRVITALWSLQLVRGEVKRLLGSDKAPIRDARVNWSDENATWDGKLLTIGRNFNSPDVIAHEYGHRLLHSSLQYVGSPGGIEEATADIFGSLLDRYAYDLSVADKRVWEVGDRLPSGTFRKQWEQSLDGRSVLCTPAQTGFDNKDPHLTSGVANRAFYVMVRGRVTPDGTPWKSCPGPQLEGYTMSFDDAFKVWARALKLFTTSWVGYDRFRGYTLQAARELFPDLVLPFGGGTTYHNNAWATISGWDSVDVR